MGKSATRAMFAACLLIFGARQGRAGTPQEIDIPAEPLVEALGALARITNTSLLFDARMVAGIAAPALHGRLTCSQALKRLSQGSGIDAERMPNGAFLIRRRQSLTQSPTPTSSQEAAVPEILVVGRRALNVDLVRSENDIQPRKILTSEDIEKSGSGSTDEFLKTRLVDNAQSLLSTQSPVGNYGATRSLVDIRGLGTGETLILVDGHRLPSFPALDAFDQSNISGIPLNAIDRIEILPSTAGGIYGPDATGGVVNVILKHDANGIDIGATRGITGRGDDPILRVQLHAGFTTPDGGTRADLFFEHASEAGLSVGDRHYLASAQSTEFNNLNQGSPVIPYYFLFATPYSSSINIESDQPIFLSTKLGGGSIGSNSTYIPVADIGTPQEAAILRANAGKLDFTLPDTGEGTKKSLLTRTERNAGVITLTQRVSDDVDAFLDTVASRERGTAIGGLEFQAAYGDVDLFNFLADSPVQPNPSTPAYFLNASFPPIENTGTYETTDTLLQATGGLAARLGHGWQAEADMTFGRTTTQSRFPLEVFLAPPDPFAGTAALQAYENSLHPSPYLQEHSDDRLLDGSMRIAGSLFQLPAGPLSATLQGEWRSDQTNGIHYTVDQNSVDQQSVDPFVPTDSPGQRLDDKSAYVELRAPLVNRTSPLVPIRGLQLQIAVRGDLAHIMLPQGAESLAGARSLAPSEFVRGAISEVREHYDMLAYTVGAKTEPFPFLTFRASYATGYQPPVASDLSVRGLEEDPPEVADPKRNGETLGSEGTVIDMYGANNLRASHYSSLLVGTIIHSLGPNPVRLSIDFNRLLASRQVFELPTGGGDVLDFYGPFSLLYNESGFPDRIIRAPLTATDIASGYTAGVIKRIDLSAMSSASTNENSIDFDLRYQVPTTFGTFSMSGAFNWILQFKKRTAPGQPWYTALGTLDGPSSWKGNVALSWTKGIVSVDTDLQVFSTYKIRPALDIVGGFVDVYSNEDRVLFPAEAGRTTVPIQAYADAAITFRVKESTRHALTIRLTCQDILDTLPPPYIPPLTTQYDSSYTLGYSYFGDPRGRRFTLGVNVAL